MELKTAKDMEKLIANGDPQFDDDGNVKVDLATCGHCGRTWNDAMMTSWTPTPSARCPFEYWHKYPRPRKAKKSI